MNIKVANSAKATQVVNEADTLFIFDGSMDVESKIGAVDWYRTDGSLERSNSEELSPGEGGYYIRKGEVSYAPFYVFSCRPANLKMTAEVSCDNTTLHLSGDLTSFTYTRMDGSEGTYARACTVEYTALAWNGEAWADSLALDSMSLEKTIYLPPLYGATGVTLCYDNTIRARLDLPDACAQDTLPPDSIKAVNFQLTSLATAREDDKAGNNERNRPTSQTLITGSEYSGPLEVAFYSNPTPAVEFFSWAIYKATERIVTRSDQDIRYTFSEPGSYRVVCAVNNPECKADSMETTVSISESYLAVPNVFTPNGDGINDEFRVGYRSLKEFHCWVYNRWGKLVYEWTDPAKGWDGNIGGRPAAEGAYFYVIRALGTDAPKDAQYTMKAVYNKKKLEADESLIGVYQMSGDINLLRGKRN